MSKHLPRKQRWAQASSTRYVSALGTVVYQERAWFGVLEYRTAAFDECQLPVWTAHTLRLGPYKRPRNAMVELEREVTALRNTHGKNVLFGQEIWAEQ